MQRPAGYQLVRLANGESSVRSLAHQETFHPVIGPMAEAQALYVKQLRLLERLDRERTLTIWDVGLGSAANPLTVLRAAGQSPAAIHIISFDQTTEPLCFALQHYDELPYLSGYEKPLSDLARERQTTFLNGRSTVTWQLQLADFPTLLKQPLARALPKPQAILFDAYSPAKNPAMWTLDVFEDLFRLLDPMRPCALATYSRSTLLRASLLVAGFYVGAGHATGEKEETTIAANSIELIDAPLDRRWLKRAQRSTSAEPLREPAYRQAPLSRETLERLQRHPQFQ